MSVYVGITKQSWLRLRTKKSLKPQTMDWIVQRQKVRSLSSLRLDGVQMARSISSSIGKRTWLKISRQNSKLKISTPCQRTWKRISKVSCQFSLALSKARLVRLVRIGNQRPFVTLRRHCWSDGYSSIFRSSGLYSFALRPYWGGQWLIFSKSR